MYRVITYHGKGNKDVENDLRLIWNNLYNFTKSKKVHHIYCFQAVKDKTSPYPPAPSSLWGEGKGLTVALLLVIQYDDSVATKLGSSSNKGSKESWLDENQPLQTHNHVDYWFFVREGR